MGSDNAYTPTRPRDDRDDIVSELVGRNVRTLRQRRGWSERELARQAGIAPATVCHVESGCGGALRTLSRIAHALDCSWAAIGPSESDVDAELLKWPWNKDADRRAR